MLFFNRNHEIWEVQPQTSTNERIKRGLYSAVDSTNSTLVGMTPLCIPVTYVTNCQSLMCVSTNCSAHTQAHAHHFNSVSSLIVFICKKKNGYFKVMSTLQKLQWFNSRLKNNIMVDNRKLL